MNEGLTPATLSILRSRFLRASDDSEWESFTKLESSVLRPNPSGNFISQLLFINSALRSKPVLDSASRWVYKVLMLAQAEHGFS